LERTTLPTPQRIPADREVRNGTPKDQVGAEVGSWKQGTCKTRPHEPPTFGSLTLPPPYERGTQRRESQRQDEASNAEPRLDPALDEAVAVGLAAQRAFPGGQRAHDPEDRLGHDEGDRGEVKAAELGVPREAPAHREAEPGGDEAPDHEGHERGVEHQHGIGQRPGHGYSSTIALNPP
jgi:hypothetical protein